MSACLNTFITEDYVHIGCSQTPIEEKDKKRLGRIGTNELGSFNVQVKLAWTDAWVMSLELLTNHRVALESLQMIAFEDKSNESFARPE